MLPAVGQRPGRPAGRALPHPPRGPRAAGGARAAPAGRARARRPALGRRRLAGARRAPAAAAAARARALALAFRPAPVRPLLATALATAERDGSVIEHALGALSFADAEALLGADVPGAGARRDLRGGRRQPVLPAAARAPARGRAQRHRRAGRRAACRARSRARWSRRSRRSARTGGGSRRARPWPATRSTSTSRSPPPGSTRPTALDALDELLAGALLAGTDVPRRYRFRHPLVRLAIYDSAAEGWRIAAHGRAAAALAERGGSLAARAHHLERCARPGRRRGARGAGRGRPARRGARARHRRRPLRRRAAAAARDAGDAAAPARAAGRAGAGAGGDRPARAGAGGARRRARAGRARSSRPCARGSWPAARCARTCSAATPPRTRGCSARWTRSARRARSPPPTSRSSSPPTRSTTATSPACARVGAAGARHRGGDRRARRSPPSRPRWSASARSGSARSRTPQRLREDAAARLDALDDGALAGRLDTAYYLGFAEFFCEHYDDAIRHFRRGIAVSRASGQGQFVIPMTIGLAHALEVRGRLAEAAEHADAAVEGARLWGNDQMLCFALTADAWVSRAARRAGPRARRGRRGDGAARRPRRERARRARPACTSPPRSSRPASPRAA